MYIVWVFLFLIIFPRQSFAYVDPGFLSVIYQYVYIVIFGILTALILRPWNFLKSLFKKRVSEPPRSTENDRHDKN